MHRRAMGWLAAVLLLTVAWAGVAAGGAPNASLVGPARAALDLVLPYYPASARAAALGRGTVALEGVDSHNPAALAFYEGFDVCFDYGRANFRHGPDFDIGHGQFTFPMPLLGGTSKLMAFGMRTRNDDVSRMMGMRAEITACELGMAYGTKVPLPDAVPGELGVGFAGFPYDPADLELSTPGGRTMARSHAMSQIGSIRLGTLYKPIEEVSLGLVFTHIKDYAWAKYPGLGTARRFESNYHVNLWEAGVAVRPIKSTTVLAQYLFGTANGQAVDMNYGIFSMGIEHVVHVADDFSFALRGGWLDNGPTFGTGVGLPGQWRADYALIPHYGEGVAKAFGHGPFHMLSVGKSF